MKKLIFADVKDDILAALNKVRDDAGITEPVGLIDGFITNPISGELVNAILVGGPCVPMVMLVGEKTGRLYFFALKTLLPGRVD
jgi:hypothetical protein